KDSATLLIVDADDFKSINDTFGHLFGDAVLREMGRAIRSNFRQTDIRGRIGGDEFIVMLPGMASPEVTARHCARLCRSLSRVFNAGSKTHAFSISVGAAQFPQHGQSYRELFNHADQALYEAKRRGKGQYVLYDHDMPISSELIGRQDDTAVAVSPVPAVRDTEQSETIAELQARIHEMESTISCMEKLLNTLLVKQ
ncbi:MAG: GGDEF domain-containing protein, partial [Selenomonas sp.]|nr:GGDEF domain-containing protein [Selenomonas sp.]